MKKYIVYAGDESFREKETFNDIDEAIAYADKMGDIFGSWNVKIVSVDAE